MSKLESSPESPLPLRRISQALAEWIGRLGEVWVEGQVAQFTQRPGVATYFLTLRDSDANISMQVTCNRTVLTEPLREGARVVLRARPDFYAERGSLSLRATEIRQVGIGELLARIERLRQLLASEGLFAAERKRRLPFLPQTIGLITGRASAAEKDVVENVRRRLPGARFEIENAATQGTNAVNEVIDALKRLDARPDVQVIVIARGGGSVEDLLPFSNEALLRAVVACRTPVVSAIGHEADQPLLDLVADLAASTPTDAAKRIVPDLAEEDGRIHEARHRLRQAIHRRLDHENQLIAGLPERLHRAVRGQITTGAQEIERARGRIRSRLDTQLQLAHAETAQLLARVISLSPQAVLDRGYAVVWDSEGALVRDAADTFDGEPLRVRVADGEFSVVVGADPEAG
ncbi:exodeoxyribonuclease VII large subunit [Jatrophihabitans telluris]|uniref:Exodeoxyribonuclease 7 large subunit n=1 Tax=Jatrophihabitans telluris TaxID=2038343 RepID=A0ABY4QX40_9ACTN|nr:exodeoxyribonuclease VII large subunit [Jatrophihabitans telluris]UQX87757.1 exodeoxyribonuclease VII large subunit [Jatrophihabitans telluris]